MRIIVKNGHIVNSDKCYKSDILIEGDKIADISDDIKCEADKIIDATGCLVFPGFIDAHTHLDMETAVTVTADNFDTGTKAAILGGTTTIVDFATQDRGMTLTEAVDKWHKKADNNSHCNYGFHMAVSEWNETTKKEIRQMTKEGIKSYKVYMTYSNLMLSDEEILALMEEVKKENGIVCCHCENHGMVTYKMDYLHGKGEIAPKYHPVSRPAEVEAEAINRFLYLAKTIDIPVMIAHISTKLGLDEVRFARKRGQNFYVETCPQYFTLDDSRYNLPTEECTKYTCTPPLRSREDIVSIKEAIKNNDIDIISTDHCSFNNALKLKLGKDDFTKVPNGLPSIQNRSEMVYTHLVKTGIIDETSMMRYLSEMPAKIYGIYDRKGSIAKGKDADIVIWDKQYEHVITGKELAHNVDYTPFEGMKACGRAKYVILNGELAVSEGKVIKEFSGKFIKR